jgi:hypothetical protein
MQSESTYSSKISLYSFIACAFIILYFGFFFYPKWNKPGSEASISWDVATYYWYLPSAFIYKDLKHQSFADSITTKYHPFGTGALPYEKQDNGGYVITYTCGMALMYAPLFFTAHLIAKPLGYPADGFSIPYQLALQLGSILFALIGLWYYRKLLRLYFNDAIVAILLLVLVLGTTYLNYSAIDAAMAHSWLFTIYALLLLNTHYFYQKPSNKYALRIGILSGLAILIRPSEVICILIPLLWNMESLSKTAWAQKFKFLKEHVKHIALATICIICIGSIQLLYWKYVSGHWVVYSYGSDKTFSWWSPHLQEYVFSYKSGWLRYCPIMLFALLGIASLIRNGKNKVAILVFSLLNLYIISAWDIWWYAGLPARAMIQGYAVLLFPFGYFLQSAFTKQWLKWTVTALLALFAYVNVWVVINAHFAEGLFDGEQMTEAYYKRVIGRWYVNPDAEKLKDTDELFEGTPKNKKLVYANDFEGDTSITQKYEPINGQFSDYVEAGKEYSKSLKFSFDKGNADWLRVQATFRATLKEWDIWSMPQLTVKFIRDGQVIKDRGICVHRFLSDYRTKDLYLDIRIPEEPYDKVEVFIWNRGSRSPLLYDDIKVWTFNEE